MSQYAQHVETIRRMALQHEQMVQVANALEGIASLEDRTASLEAQHQAAMVDLDAAHAALAASKDEHARIRDEHARAVEIFEQNFQTMKADADRQAEEIIKAATQKAHQITADAEGALQGELQVIRDQIIEAQGQLTGVHADVAKAHDQHEVTRTELQRALQSQLQSVRDQIAEAIKQHEDVAGKLSTLRGELVATLKQKTDAEDSLKIVQEHLQSIASH